MVFEWPSKKCIVCLRPSEKLSKAHVIPESIGGTLIVRSTCRTCNSTLGRWPESSLKTDPAIALAIFDLKRRHTDLRIRTDRQILVTEDSGPRVRVRNRDGAVLATPQTDGSMVKSSEEGLKEIETTLRRSRASRASIEEAVEKVSRAPTGNLVEVAPNLSVRKGKAESLGPELTGEPVPDECFLAIAYSFLAILVGESIYSSKLQVIRDAVRGFGSGRGWFVEQSILRQTREPRHEIWYRRTDTGSLIRVVLFGNLIWDVHLDGVGTGPFGESIVYGLNLVGGRELWEQQTNQIEGS
ncbi:MAG: hypothetical protein KDB66_08905 [Solirubrobacterales bacterium]|nr:hypothetical protein [Solirubrobacterales bacterium]